MKETLPKKSLGQHWLSDQASLDEVCVAAQLKAGETIVEIGPGTGELTAKLLEHGVSVVAVELDKSLEKGLLEKFKGLPFSLNMLSILEFDFSALPSSYKIVANIPYYLTNHLLRLLTEIQHKPELVCLLVQKEVAERVAARPGSMSLLSISAQLHYEVSLGQIITADKFSPPPKVDSQILVLALRNQELFPNLDEKRFFQITKAGFSSRRKTLLNTLSSGIRLTKSQTEDVLVTAGVSPGQRAQELSLQNWFSIYKKLS